MGDDPRGVAVTLTGNKPVTPRTLLQCPYGPFRMLKNMEVSPFKFLATASAIADLVRRIIDAYRKRKGK